jgi:hypothetical protein
MADASTAPAPNVALVARASPNTAARDNENLFSISIMIRLSRLSPLRRYAAWSRPAQIEKPSSDTIVDLFSQRVLNMVSIAWILLLRNLIAERFVVKQTGLTLRKRKAVPDCLCPFCVKLAALEHAGAMVIHEVDKRAEN